ncbi:unnamed protein product [Rotaria socialis]|uniref:Cation efflux protein transmembrane domain-containing protein n=1 Tax=Rotaria socialis TaxID=392032 RepID=A0A818F3Z7_9BILA|nr:unnamed protein product [Rotaria socialis]CAF3373055.1 unnamed protein product [Rotaria socialis]CAF3430455.1 unnamed protein product [Rotaria socialis]CAF3467887.1 unnamed protein product [Rotaria socialis]CAF3747224.1 unnamed protein product [Rotaria socialis]
MFFGFPERLFPHAKYDSHRMRIFALAISWISIVYNGIEGGASIGLGADSISRALIVFGIQSFVEVFSAMLVIYRFRREFNGNSPPNLSLERRATLGIGLLFILLTIGTWVASILALVTHSEPDSSKPSLIVSASALGCMLFVWLPKPWIATELNSSVMHGEASCSLACIYLTIVLFVGSLIYKLWHGGWWIDSAVAILLGFFFLRQGWNMISWARDKEFNGGCCKACSAPSSTICYANKTATSNNCNGDCSQTCSVPSATVCCANKTTTSDDCNDDCSQTSSIPSATVCCANKTTTSNNCNDGCHKKSATSSSTASSTNIAGTSVVECENVRKCNCCASKKECVEAGTCVCGPLLCDKALGDILCCSGPTKCCPYGMTAAFLV